MMTEELSKHYSKIKTVVVFLNQICTKFHNETIFYIYKQIFRLREVSFPSLMAERTVDAKQENEITAPDEVKLDFDDETLNGEKYIVNYGQLIYLNENEVLGLI